jgi:hypothetical protein
VGDAPYVRSAEDEAQQREAEAREALRSGNRRKWLVGALFVLGIAAWFVWPLLRSPCSKARAEICRKLLVSCKRTTAGMEANPPPHEWCEQFLDSSFVSDRDRAARTVLDRYPVVELTEEEMAQLRAGSGRRGITPIP